MSKEKEIISIKTIDPKGYIITTNISVDKNFMSKNFYCCLIVYCLINLISIITLTIFVWVSTNDNTISTNIKSVSEVHSTKDETSVQDKSQINSPK